MVNKKILSAKVESCYFLLNSHFLLILKLSYAQTDDKGVFATRPFSRVPAGG